MVHIFKWSSGLLLLLTDFFNLHFLGPDLPINVEGFTMISSPTEKRIVVIGGCNNGSGASYTLMEMSGDSKENFKWTILDERLRYSRYGPHVSFPISSKVFDDLKKKFFN